MKHHLYILIIVVCLWGNTYLFGNSFATLSDIQAYAKNYPEYVNPDHDDWLHPNFTLFYKKTVPYFFQRIVMKLGLPTKAWNFAQFVNVLQDVVSRYQERGFKDAFAVRFNPNQGDTCILWGDIKSAFHSLVRDLTFLHKQGILTNDFKIKDTYYFIFDGNVIEGSPYVLETLMVLLRLIQVNPDQVFYIRGYNESYDRWKNFEMINQIKAIFAANTKKYQVLVNTFQEFFQLLPLAFYVTKETNNEIQAVAIHNDIQYFKNFDVQRIAALTQVKTKLGFFSYDQEPIANTKPIIIRAFITGEDRSISYQLTDGLIQAGDIEGALRWVIFSSPTQRSQILYKFYYDAFVQLAITNGIDRWTLSLFNQKNPDPKSFTQSAVYNLITGQSTQESKVHEKKELIIGATMDLSKSLSTTGKPLKQGLDLAFAQAARQGGIGSFMPRLVVYDDEYTPSLTRQILKKFKKNNIDVLVNAMGSPTNQIYLPSIKKGELLNLFPYTGSALFRDPSLHYMAHYRVGYNDEGGLLAEYALDELGMQKAVIFYQNDAFGKGEMQGAMDLLKERGFTDVTLVPYERNDVQFDSQAKAIRAADPDTIFFFAVTPAARSLIQQMGVQFFYRKNLIGTSVYDESFDRFLNDKGLKFIMVRMVPHPQTSNLEIVQEYRTQAEQANQTPNLVSLEAYINASIFFEILRRIKPPFTKEKFIQELEKINHYNFKGLELNYNPETHELGKLLWIDTGDQDWIEKRVHKKSKNIREIKDQ